MKIFKQVDLYINISLIAGFTIATLINTEILFKAYFIIGGWQLLSMITHAFSSWFMKKGGARSSYHWLVIVILSVVLLGQIITPLLIIFFLLLFGSPVLAIIYTKICCDELKELKSRRSLSLK